MRSTMHAACKVSTRRHACATQIDAWTLPRRVSSFTHGMARGQSHAGSLVLHVEWLVDSPTQGRLFYTWNGSWTVPRRVASFTRGMARGQSHAGWLVLHVEWLVDSPT